ncbi:OapA family protein [Marinimicrobium sp. ABcell2]|uniref:OapA family protein n=1 Tax=Marinimicrobium sp. ABcell2 TaxID=3069751 RepID=UPI0027AEC897|nr:peptidoglycan DD-metalloendopeptidase family protein [Marinimicrobium sp. ABcell2]MDQ2075716.1 peptidoglycan DD-metalloendopeptidase family protein [Marinimicrobium sp. ABcell2]
MEPSEKQDKNLALNLLKQYPRGHAMAAGILLGGLCLAVIGLPSNEASASRQSLDVELPLATSPLTTEQEEEQSALEVTEPEEPFFTESWEDEPVFARETFTIQSGDSLSRLFNRAGLNDRALYELMNESPEARALHRIMPGHEVTFEIDTEGKLNQLIYDRSRLSSLVFTRDDGSFVASEVVREPDVQTAYRQATIDSSLFLAGARAGMSDSIIMELANIFGWDIDFILDIRRGDTFSVLFEERFLDGEKIGNGPILAAEFNNRGRSFQAVRYVNSDGRADYYTPDGKSMRRAFLRTPVEFTRISSPFNPNRRHPVLNTIRAHQGTDYAAPRGTPIKAAGDGRVTLAGRKGGYGNTVIIQHGQTYKTLYAHLHNFHRSIRSGVNVRQGQIIGYVGSTGLATGPHLHYEFHVNGVVKNPVTVALPQADPIPQAELARFKAQTQPIMAQLEQHLESTTVAMSGEDNRGIN